jgi:hypothetical protein
MLLKLESYLDRIKLTDGISLSLVIIKTSAPLRGFRVWNTLLARLPLGVLTGLLALAGHPASSLYC